MRNWVRFTLWWGLLLMATAIVAAIAVPALVSLSGFEWKSEYNIILKMVIGLVLAGLILGNRVAVPHTYEYVYEWIGKPLKPFKPGWHYPFPYFTFLSGPAKVPMNDQTLHILTGSREGLDDEIVNLHVYGSSSNIEPNNGDYVRLLYKVVLRCVDSIALVYNHTDPYAYVAGLVEFEVVKYVKGYDSEEVNDQFVKRDWGYVVNDLNIILPDAVGLELLSFIPMDVLNTPETEEQRRKLNEAKTNTQLLEEEEEQMDKKIKIGKKKDSILRNSIESIKQESGVDGGTALSFLRTERTLETVVEASKHGNFTYMDASGSGKLSEYSALGWGINSHAPKTKQSSKNSDEEEGEENAGGREKKSKVKVVKNKKQ